jgi:hypothetical protein
MLQISAWALLVACSGDWAFGEISLAALLGYVAACIGIMVRRPWTPSRSDLLVVRFGFIPLCLLSVALFYLIWKARGVL